MQNEEQREKLTRSQEARGERRLQHPRLNHRGKRAGDLLERDREILRLFLTVRLITLPELYALLKDQFPSEYVLWRRLWNLFNDGYIAKPIQQPRDRKKRRGNVEDIYALANRGAYILRQEGHDLPSIDWDEKAREIKPFSFDHPLLATRFITCVWLALKKRPGYSLEWIMRDPKLDRTVTLSDGMRTYEFSITPDVYFVIKPEHEPKPLFYACEIDRGTMPVKRSSFMQSSFYKHVAKYLEYWNIIGCPENFNVLTVTTNDERQKQFHELVTGVSRDKANLFWFTTKDKLSLEYAEDLLFGEIWTTGTGEQGSIF